jgi:uncharacterized protein (DUF1501 family)
MLIKRKDFLQVGSLATASVMLPKFLKAFEKPSTVPPGNKVLVVLQFSGGNDGLNTVIPITNDIYYNARPKLAIAKTDALQLTTDVGLNPALSAFKSLYDAGNLSVLNGVGYPNPNRSHFRSMDIWHSASKSTEYVNTGWLGRYLDAQCNGCAQPTQALEIDDVLSLALKGQNNKALALKDPARLYNGSTDKLLKQITSAHTSAHETVDYLYKTMAETLSSAEYIFKQSKKSPTNFKYPSTDLGKSLQTISSLIQSDINTKVYYVSVGSFDTHINQQTQQKRLFTQINDAVAAFTTDLKNNNRFNDVLLMTFSEFGRRVTQNASGGTDHGTASNMFFVSGALKQKGILNAMPNLQNLVDGDLQHTVDFKQVYATVLDNWLGANHKDILGSTHQTLSFI